MVDFVNWLLSGAATIANAMLAILPNTPFSWDSSAFTGWLGLVNYFIPLQAMVTELGVFVGAVLTWYSIRWILRIIRFIGG